MNIADTDPHRHNWAFIGYTLGQQRPMWSCLTCKKLETGR